MDDLEAHQMALSYSRLTQSNLDKTRDLVKSLDPILNLALDRRAEILREIAAIEHAGHVDASPHYRAGKYLYLIHPTRNGKRIREYIGRDPEKVREALARIRRERKFKYLRRELEWLERLLSRVQSELSLVHSTLSVIRSA